MTTNINQLENVYQESLHVILEQGQRLEACLAKYPELAEELRPRLEASLWLHEQKTAVEPRPGYTSAGKRRLMARLQRESALRSSLRRFRTWLRRPVTPAARIGLAFALALAIFANGTAVNAAARVSFPGEVLYPIKKAEEKIHLSVTPSGLPEIELHLTYAQRRAGEIETLIMEGRYEHLPAAVIDFERQVNQAVLLLARLDKNDSNQAGEQVKQLEQTLNNQASILKILVQLTPAQNQKELNRAIRAAEFSLATVQFLGFEHSYQPYQN